MEESMKICKICKEVKPIIEYNKAGKGKWLQPYCKPCDSKRKRDYYTKNASTIIIKQRQKYLKNRVLLSDEERAASRIKSNEALIKNAKEYRDKIKMSAEEKKRRKSESNKKYREANKEKIKLKKKEYYDEFGLEKTKEWQKKQRNNINYITKKKLRCRVYVALKRGVKSESTVKLLGCSIDEFKKHFESLFTDGMNWDNYIKGQIHIDHIIPCKSFDLSNFEEQKKCFHYTNLQPLWAIDNLKKGAKTNFTI